MDESEEIKQIRINTENTTKQMVGIIKELYNEICNIRDEERKDMEADDVALLNELSKKCEYVKRNSNFKMQQYVEGVKQLEKQSTDLKTLEEKENDVRNNLEIHLQQKCNLQENPLGNDIEKLLQVLRESVRAAKLLTCTTFDYQSTNVSGFMVNKSQDRYKTFDFNSQNLTEEEITDNLWKYLEQVSGEDWSDVLEMN